MSAKKKVGEAMRLSLYYLRDDAQAGMRELLEPENQAIIAVTIELWGMSHFFGVGEFVDAILAVVGEAVEGISEVAGAWELHEFYTTAVNAQSAPELEIAGHHLSQAVLILGITVVGAVLLRVAGRLARARPADVPPAGRSPVDRVQGEVPLKATEPAATPEGMSTVDGVEGGVPPNAPDNAVPKGVTNSEEFGPPFPADAAKAAAASRPANATRLGVTRTNAADWRDLRDWWDQHGYGEILSERNRALIAKGKPPIVDDAWIAAFPEDAGLVGEKISMHHIGGSPITVPLPATRHLDAHMPGGFRYNPGGPGGSAPFYPADE